MASAYSRKGKWYLCFKNRNGRWQRQVSQARTKTEARRMAEELERAHERQRLGLAAPLPEDGGETLEEMLAWWLREYSAQAASHDADVSRVQKHFQGSRLGRTRVYQLRAGDIERFLQAKGEALSAATVNQLRACISRAYTAAIRAERFLGVNPVVAVKPRKVTRAAGDYLRPEEVPAVLDAVPLHWRPLFAAAVYTGLRRGELFALQKADVDLEGGLLRVGRSHARDTTKGGRVATIPIAKELRPFLKQALRSEGPLVFPGHEGGRWSRHTKLQNILRSALARAGIVTGFEHVCRRKGCGHSEQALDDAMRRCPEHGMKLWPRAQVRPIRFHDLRHTTASLLMMSGANPAAVQRILRHSDPRITMDVYGHLSPGYLRSEIDRLQFGVKASRRQKKAVQAVADVTPPFIPPVSQEEA